jgi:DNA topoisomerase-6 subunit B
MQAGQKLSRHIRSEQREADLERKLQHIEQFGPILVEGLVRMTKSNAARQKRAEEGLKKLLGRDAAAAEEHLDQAKSSLEALKKKESYLQGDGDDGEGEGTGIEIAVADSEEVSRNGKEKKKAAKTTKKVAAKKSAVREKEA